MPGTLGGWWNDPVRRRFGGFAAFRSPAWRIAYWTVLAITAGAAMVAGGFAKGSVSWRRIGEYAYVGGLLVSPLVCLIGAMAGALALAIERTRGTFESILLSPYPRLAIGRAIMLGAFLRAVTFGLVPAAAWLGYGATRFADLRFLPVALAAIPVLGASAYMGACIGCHCNRVSRGVVTAVVRAFFYSFFFHGLVGCSTGTFTACSGMALGVAGGVLVTAAWLGAWGYAFWRDYVGWFGTEFETLAEDGGELSLMRWL